MLTYAPVNYSIAINIDGRTIGDVRVGLRLTHQNGNDQINDTDADSHPKPGHGSYTRMRRARRSGEALTSYRGRRIR